MFLCNVCGKFCLRCVLSAPVLLHMSLRSFLRKSDHHHDRRSYVRLHGDGHSLLPLIPIHLSDKILQPDLHLLLLLRIIQSLLLTMQPVLRHRCRRRSAHRQTDPPTDLPVLHVLLHLIQSPRWKPLYSLPPHIP